MIILALGGHPGVGWSSWRWAIILALGDVLGRWYALILGRRIQSLTGGNITEARRFCMPFIFGEPPLETANQTQSKFTKNERNIDERLDVKVGKCSPIISCYRVIGITHSRG